MDIPRLLLKVKIYYRKSTSVGQNILSKVDFWKSKYITESRLSEVKIYYQKSTSESQNILSKVDFRKSKYISGSQYILSKFDFRELKYITKGWLLEVKILIMF